MRFFERIKYYINKFRVEEDPIKESERIIKNHKNSNNKDKSGIPFYIQMLGKLVPIVDYKKEYDSNDINFSVGEIRKFNFVEGQKNQHSFGKSVSDGNGRWVHLADDWFKNVTHDGEDMDVKAFIRNRKLNKI